jgi:ribosomal protein S12 methylthiotransferase accessory factor YcaO
MRIRKIVTLIDEARAEAGIAADPVLRKVATAAIIKNSFAGKRAAVGATIDIPLAHKDALYVRSHYDGISITLPDAPLPDEIAIICAYANRGRLNDRVGGLAAHDIKAIDGLV